MINQFKICKTKLQGNIFLAALLLAPLNVQATTLLPHWVYSDNFRKNASNKIYRLTPQQQADRAENRLKRGLYKKALKDFEIIESNSGFSEFASYGKALTLTQQGKLKEAFNIVQSLLAQYTEDYRAKVEDLEAALLIMMAQEALHNKDIQTASHHLKYFVSKYKNTPYNSTALMLIQKINRRFKPADDSGKPLKIAVLLPTSGEYAAIGQHLLKSAQLALFDTANEGLLLYPLNT
jgi:predicted Zn-dependent protease